MKEDDLLHLIALKFIPGVGDISAKKLISYVGSVQDIFTQSRKVLSAIPGISQQSIQCILDNKEYFSKAEQELKFIQKENVQATAYYEKSYPVRLKQCDDGPFLLFYKGLDILNQQRIISVVGTRKATEYGKVFTEQLIERLRAWDVLVVSGLAYGIDIASHRAALKNGLHTAAVVAHGLNLVYPAVHRATAAELMQHGAMVSEYTSQDKMMPEFFPMRNRIIAGLCDALIMVESGTKGGSLITAVQASSYNREVFALPGRNNDPQSSGCNFFIKTQRANMIESADDLVQIMGWQMSSGANTKHRQLNIFQDVSPNEKSIIDILQKQQNTHIDLLAHNLQISTSELTMDLLELELKGIVRVLPGSMYALS